MSKVNDTYEEAPMTQEEMQNEVAINENELLKALTSERVSSDTKTIEVSFNGIAFRFRIRAVNATPSTRRIAGWAVCVCRKAPTRPATIPA